MEEKERMPVAMEDVKLEEEDTAGGKMANNERRGASESLNGTPSTPVQSDTSPEESKPISESPPSPGTAQAPKLSRKASQKSAAVAVKLYDHLPDATAEACANFQVINECLYGSKNMGASDIDVLDCDCSEEWRDGQNHACCDGSDCINRATKMECVDGDCNCGPGCQNQRFQRRQYAKVTVIKTEKKGYGLRADSDLQTNDFIWEYVGEVINEPTLRRRMLQYDDEGIKHFYFMSLSKSEFVDATKKGNLGRFCNHSCRPNCYVDKWVVGSKVRMGIFAGRPIKAGEELVFNYNVDRYGADPQPCYCGEPNCTGFIGGKTQTERATKLPEAIIEALGIDDPDGWDTTVAKRPRKKRANEDDEEYVNSLQARKLDEAGVTKVMAALRQCQEKWVAVKLLSRIQQSEDERVMHQVVRMHGYLILKASLNQWKDDDNVVLQILDILNRLPRLTKNKISDSKIEGVVESLTSSAHEDVANESRRLLEAWSKLETAYRIPRKKYDPNAPTTNNSFEERRDRGDRAAQDAAAKDAAATQASGAARSTSPIRFAPKGPRATLPQRNANYFNGMGIRQQPFQRRHGNFGLPAGWFSAQDARGHVYYYNRQGVTTWQRPTAPAAPAGPGATKAPSKAAQDQKSLQDIIDSLTKDPAPRVIAAQAPRKEETPTADTKQEKWRSLPIEKQKKIYENTLAPHVKHVMEKFRHALPREELKRFAKEVAKTLVASDYKNNRVTDPTTISRKQEKKVKEYVRDYFQRAVEKYNARQAKNAAATGTSTGAVDPQADSQTTSGIKPSDGQATAVDVSMTDDEDAETPSSNSRKRARDDDVPESASMSPSETPSVKRLKEDEVDVPSPPPPPPPPPPAEEAGDEMPILDEGDNMTQRAADEAERSRMRLEEEALERENEEAMRDYELSQANGASTTARADANLKSVRLDSTVNGVVVNGTDEGGHDENQNEALGNHGSETRKQEVLSH